MGRGAQDGRKGERLAEREAKQQFIPRGAVSVCAGGWGQSQILQPLRRGGRFGESESPKSQRFGGRDLDAPALPAGNRCLWSWGGPGQ